MGGNAPSFGAMTARREGLPARSDSRPHWLQLCDRIGIVDIWIDAMVGLMFDGTLGGRNVVGCKL